MIPILKGMTKGQTRRGGRSNNFIIPVAALVMLFLIGQAVWLSRNSHMFTPFSITRMECPHCQKVGVVRDEKDNSIMRMCPVCFGMGYHSYRRFDVDDMVCTACGGMGRTDIKSTTWRNCERCDGRGLYRIGEWMTVVEVQKQVITMKPVVSETVFEEVSPGEPGSLSDEDQTAEDKP